MCPVQRRGTRSPYEPVRHALGPALVLAGALHTSLAAGEDDAVQPPIQDLFKTDLVFAQQRGELQLNAFPTYASGTQDDEAHDPNVWFANLGGYTVWR
jgi:hypothetical protein